MGYYSSVIGVVHLNPALTQEQAKDLAEKIMAERDEYGVGDWTLTAGLDGLMCAWEESFKAGDAKEGLEKILAEMLPEGVVAEGRIEKRGETNEDIEAWVVRDGKVTVLEAKVVLDVEAFVKEVLGRLEPLLGGTPKEYTPDQVKAAVLEAFLEFQDEVVEDGERLDLEEWLSDEEEEEEEEEEEDDDENEEEEDTWDEDVDGEDE